jgi:hypothetical protein
MSEPSSPAGAASRRLTPIIAVVALCSLISAVVAYRFGLRKGASFPAAAPTTSSGAPCSSYQDAAALVGKDACITGRVLNVVTSKAGNTYLDFCQDYRTCPFSSVIFKEDRGRFGDLQYLQGRFVELRGLVSTYKERPQIIVRAPEQIKLRQ